MIECENGEKFYTDHVICTVPLGFLKEKPKLFEPVLPKYKIDAMNRLNFGTVNKIFLEYDKPFLSPAISEVILLWDKPNETGVQKKGGIAQICQIMNYYQSLQHSKIIPIGYTCF